MKTVKIYIAHLKKWWQKPYDRKLACNCSIRTDIWSLNNYIEMYASSVSKACYRARIR